MGEPPSRPPAEDKEAFALHDLYKPLEEDDGEKELKVMIPASYHKKLHGYKVLTGRTISLMVNEALDYYFWEQKQERED